MLLNGIQGTVYLVSGVSVIMLIHRLCPEPVKINVIKKILLHIAWFLHLVASVQAPPLCSFIILTLSSYPSRTRMAAHKIMVEAYQECLVCIQSLY